MQPRQIYASTMSRRERRWTGRRGHGNGPLSIALVGAATFAAALIVIVTLAPGLS